LVGKQYVISDKIEKIKKRHDMELTKDLNTILVYNLPLHHYNVCIS
jgi:hypothetical protein